MRSAWTAHTLLLCDRDEVNNALYLHIYIKYTTHELR